MPACCGAVPKSIPPRRERFDRRRQSITSWGGPDRPTGEPDRSMDRTGSPRGAIASGRRGNEIGRPPKPSTPREDLVRKAAEVDRSMVRSRSDDSGSRSPAVGSRPPQGAISIGRRPERLPWSSGAGGTMSRSGSDARIIRCGRATDARCPALRRDSAGDSGKAARKQAKESVQHMEDKPPLPAPSQPAPETAAEVAEGPTPPVPLVPRRPPRLRRGRPTRSRCAGAP